VKSRLLLDVVVAQSTPILKLLSGKDQTLLVRGDALLVLDLSLHIVDGVRGLNIQSDGLSGQSLDKNLHSSTETQHQVKSRLLLDVVVAQSTPILKLLSGKDQTLLVRGDALLVLDLSLHIVDGVRGLHIQSDGFSGQSLDKNLHDDRFNLYPTIEVGIWFVI